MSRNTIARIYKSNERHFTRDLKEARNLDENKVHEVRVDIKNLRVLLELLSVVTGKKRKGGPLLKQLEPVFRKAGRIRSAGLNLKLSQPYRSQLLIKFRQHQRLQQQQARLEFLVILKRFDFEKFRKQNEKALDQFRSLKNKKVQRSAEEYIRVLFARVRADIFDISDDETLHEIRKRLKAIRNVGQLLIKMDPDFSLKGELQKISQTYDKIGQWHDTQELIDALEKYVGDLDSPEALEKSAPLIIALKKKCLFNKRQIEKRLKAELMM